jgi:hypothetical protein
VCAADWQPSSKKVWLKWDCGLARVASWDKLQAMSTMKFFTGLLCLFPASLMAQILVQYTFTGCRHFGDVTF